MINVSTRIKDHSLYPILDRVADHLCRTERWVFQQLYVLENNGNEVKRQAIAQWQISARQYNGIKRGLEGMVESYRSQAENRVESLQTKLDRVQVEIKKFDGLPPVRCNWLALHQKRRREYNLQRRLEKARQTAHDPVPHICFGGRHLFRGQHHWQQRGYRSLLAWKEDWLQARSNHFFCLGSGDETAGNQPCQLVGAMGGDAFVGHLLLRLPAGAEAGSILKIPIRWTHNARVLLHALSQSQRVPSETKQGKSIMRRVGAAISYRFVKENGHWYVHATTDSIPVPLTTRRDNGALGIDFNPDLLAGAVLDRNGNPTSYPCVKIDLHGKTSDQTKAIFGDAVKVLVNEAKQRGVPIVAEKLDFTAKKKALHSAGYNRMLSSLAYSAFHQMLQSACARSGVELISVNPAFTSVIGTVRFANGYGLSRHSAAAVAIARRALHFSERVKTRTTHITLDLPADRSRHVWKVWSAIKKQLYLSRNGWQMRSNRVCRRSKEGRNREVPISTATPVPVDDLSFLGGQPFPPPAPNTVRGAIYGRFRSCT